jgi:hypothetical protein
MPDDNIDIQCQVTLPNSQSRVFVQLRENRPERVFYRINLRDPQGNIIHVAAPATYDIPVRHDLGFSANELHHYDMAVNGIVGFVGSGQWQLRCEILVDGEVVHTCGPGALDSAVGGMARFRFICSFT